MRTKNTKIGFTLVELIVVITILAILWTIAFISLQGYSESARDSTRVSDMSKIKTTLELFHLNSWRYPEPTDPYDVEYSWELAWTQWYYWEETFKNTEKLDKVPLDPLTERKYVYSVTNNKQEFEIAWIMEDYEWWSLSSTINNNVYAWDRKTNLKITWTYNWKILKIPFWTDVYVLAIPSIITSTWWTLEFIIANNSIAVDGFMNLPMQYDSTVFDTLWDADKSFIKTDPNDYIVYTWSLDVLNQTDTEWETKRAELIDKIKNAYAWTDWETIWWVEEVVNATTAEDKEVIWTAIVHNILWWSIVPKTWSASSSSGWWSTPATPDPITITFVNADNASYSCSLCD